MALEEFKLVDYARRPSPLNPTMFMELIQDLIDSNELELFLETNRDDLIRLHHTLGRHIRNTYIYPNKEFMKPYSDKHPDDISFEIIEKLQKILIDLKKSGEDLYKLGLKRNTN